MKGSILFELAISKALRPILHRASLPGKISPRGFRRLAANLDVEFPFQIQFIRSDEFPNFVDRQQCLPKIVILGDSDKDWLLSDFEKFPETRFFVQNLLDGENTQVKLLPIGIEDLAWAKNGMPWNFTERLRRQRKEEKVLVGPFGFTHESRGELLEVAAQIQGCEVLQNRVASWSYARHSSRYKYVACPRGNGLDTHRFWESLYRGSIPIVLDSPWSRCLERYGIRLIRVSNWMELEGIREPRYPQNEEFLDPRWWELRFRRILRGEE